MAAADALLGARFPLPALTLPLVRWVEVRQVGGDGAEIEWNLDDSRPGTPGRLALAAARSALGSQLPPSSEQATASNGMSVRRCALAEAQPALRPALEVFWEAGGLHFRLTAQGPWKLADVLALADSVTG